MIDKTMMDNPPQRRRLGIRGRLIRLIKGLALLLGFLLVAGSVCALIPPSTRPIPGEYAIAELQSISLVGFKQTVLLRGNDRRNPILLYVHGGPGASQLPIARTYSDELEKHFVVAHWDQRGAGASCTGVDWNTMSLDQIVNDTTELAEKLGQGKKIFIIGHSWGCLVGVMAVQRRPDLFYTYVGTGQLVHRDRQERISYDWVVAQAQAARDTEALNELASIHPPYTTQAEFALERRWLSKYHGDAYQAEREQALLSTELFGPEYSLATKLRYQDCFDKSREYLLQDRLNVDLLSEIDQFQVPVFFLLGRHDYNTPTSLVEEWAAQLEAPHVEIVWFENAGHSLAIEVPEEFQARLLEKLLPLASE
jgi:pimeloyl-ACP methyl ester carboxylesterase